MKALFLLIFTIITTSAWSQKSVDFSHIDWKVLSIEAAAPDTLAHWLTSPYKTDLEKTRAIFRWITENIAYRAKGPYRGPFKPVKYLKPDVEDTATKLKTLDERVAEIVLTRKLAVCDGYARLFKTLCEYAGLKSEIITGFARTGYERAGNFKSNHRWNAVMIDSTWHLLDVTWASGHSTYSSDDFIKRFNDHYFLTAPQDFIRDHYPENISWTLLTEPPVPKEFSASPFKYQEFQKFKIKSYYPAKGMIEATVGDTIQFKIEGSDAEEKLLVLDSLPPDSLYQDIQYIHEPRVYLNGMLTTQYVVTGESPQWLYLLYNNQVIMRYRVKVSAKRTD